MLPGPPKDAAEPAQEYYVTVDLQYSTEEWRSPILKRLGTLRGSKVFVYTLSNSSISLGRAELPSRISAITVLRHPNVPAVLDVLLDERYIHIVTEASTLPPLLCHLVSLPEYTLGHVRELFAEMCRIVGELHSLNLFHGWINPLSFRIDPSGHRVVLEDMYSGFLADTEALRKVLARYPAFLPPELGGARQHSSAKSDVYALGLLLDLMATGGCCQRGEAPEGELQAVGELVAMMTAPLARRPALHDVLRHPFFTPPEDEAPVPPLVAPQRRLTQWIKTCGQQQTL